MISSARLAPVLLLAAAPSFAIVDWDNPRQPRGFLPQEPVVADGNGADAVSAMSGTVGLTIPVGQRFHVGGGLTWQLALSYSSSIWRYSTGSESPQGAFVEATIDSDFNAGVGYLLSLGRVYKPQSGPNTSLDWIYVSPSGSRHKFFQELHDNDTDGSTNHYYTRDSTYLRLNKTTMSAVTIEFPNGEIHTFDANNATTPGRITSIKNRFKVGTTYQNVITISYPTSNQWSISDGTRTATVNFGTLNDGNKHVTNIVMPTFDGGTFTYSFDYQQTSIRRTCYDTRWSNNVTPGSASAEEAMVSVPLLRKIDGPGQLDWKILQGSSTTTANYHPGGLRGTAGCSFAGVIESFEYPTQTKTSWTWQKWAFPPIGKEYLDFSVGVFKRTVTSPVPSINPAGTWEYTPSLGGPSGGPKDEILTRIDDPEGSHQIHYFRAPTTSPTPWDYGLPYSKYLGAGPQDGKFLSTVINDRSTGSTVQSLVHRVQFTTDPLPSNPTGSANLFTNRRVWSHRTQHETDGGKEVNVNFSDFDGVGHYRQANISDQFGSTPTRVEHVNWNDSRGCFSSCGGGAAWNDVDSTDTWMFQKFDFAKQLEGGEKIYQTYSFDGTTGFLQQVRARRIVTTNGSDPVASDNDVIMHFCASDRGNVISQRWYGGDTQSLASATIGCGVSTSSVYQLDSNWTYGTRTRSYYANANGSSVGFDSFSGVADQNTGRLKRVCDSTGYCTNLDYDTAGRLLKTEPQVPSAADAAAVVTFAYSFGTDNQWKTTITMTCPVGSPTPYNAAAFPQEKRYFDGFGRLQKTERLNADGTWSKQVAGYSKTGALHWVSEWIPVSMPDVPGNTNPWDPAPSIAPQAYTIFDNRDYFGRPRIVWKPDGKKIDLVYTGTRKLDATVRIATALDGSETPFTTSRWFDRNGRIVRVDEPAMPNGSYTTAVSSYHVGGGLKEILHTAGAVTQARSYGWDGRGFLLSETIPERTDTVGYGLYDAGGNLGQRLDGTGLHGLRISYDRAGRPLQVQAVDSGLLGPLLKTFQYDTAPGRGLGKLAVADNYNDWAAEQARTFIARQTYEYQGIAGAVSKRRSGFHDALADYEQFDVTLETDAVGQPTAIGYPTCLGGFCTGGGVPTRSVTSSHDNGWLISHDGAGFSYHTNGMLAQVVHPNGIDDNFSIDGTTREQRMLEWTTWNGTTPLAESGQFSYDGAGNIESIGPQAYRYDGVSRLVQSEEERGGPTATQETVFDGFGNIQQITTQDLTLATPTAGSTNRLTSPATSYDAEGNLTSWNGITYSYDRLNRLHRVQSGTVDMLFAYTADDERVFMQNTADAGNGLATIRGLDGQVLRDFELTGFGIPNEHYKDYVWIGRNLLRTVEGEFTGGVRTGDTVFDVSVDHLGSPHLYTAADSSQAGTYHYYPFGQELLAEANARMRFTGHERDEWSTAVSSDDMDYLHARSYHPALARFTQVDPFFGRLETPQSLNRYGYTQGNPIAFIDPNGLDLVPIPCPPGVEPPCFGEKTDVVDDAPPPIDLIRTPPTVGPTDDDIASRDPSKGGGGGPCDIVAKQFDMVEEALQQMAPLNVALNFGKAVRVLGVPLPLGGNLTLTVDGRGGISLCVGGGFASPKPGGAIFAGSGRFGVTSDGPSPTGMLLRLSVTTPAVAGPFGAGFTVAGNGSTTQVSAGAAVAGSSPSGSLTYGPTFTLREPAKKDLWDCGE